VFKTRITASAPVHWGLTVLLAQRDAMREWSIPRTAVLAGAVAIAFEAVFLATGNSAVLRGVLLDPDCYMHLQRALRLMTEGGWHDPVDPRINAPYGYAIHWTAVFDMLLAAGAAPLKAFGLDAHSALYVWGSAISPLLLVAALAIYAWGVKPRVSGLAFLWLTVLIFTQPQLSGSFIAGRPDHQSLVLGLLLAQLAWAYALFDGRAGPRWAIAAGVMGGLQLATSVEALLTILLLSAALTVAWLFYRRATLRTLALYLGAATLTAVAWLLWERGRFLIEPRYDRVSVVHVVALAGGLAGIGAVMFAEARGLLAGIGRKLIALGLALAFAAGVTAAAYPDFFLGPWPHLDPVVAAWHSEIGELQPLAQWSWYGLAAFLTQMTAPLLALPLVVRRLVNGPQSDKPVMALSLIGFVLFGGLALFQMRWSGETQAVMLLPWTLTTIAIMNSETALRIGRSRIPLRTFVLAAALLLQLVPTMATQRADGLKPFDTHPRASCHWTGAIKALPQSIADGAIVMAPIDHGPEILWRTNARIVAGPYEMLPGLKDTAAFLHGSEAAAHKVAQRRGISDVLVCSADNWPGFGGEIAVGRYPKWLKPEALKNGPKEFRLYRVVR
jgi:multisubunit Na+/H+ antiporter MnhF subunit